MRGILVLATSALLAALLIASTGCRKEAPAPAVAGKEEKTASPVAPPVEKQEKLAVEEVPSGQQPVPEQGQAGAQPAGGDEAAVSGELLATGGEAAAAVAPPPGELDPATCSDKIAVEEARVRREVLPRLRADQEANAQVAEWAAGTVKQLQVQDEESDRKRREQHWKEYTACLKDLTGARAERDPLCVAYVTEDLTACDRVRDPIWRNQCTMLVRQKKGEEVLEKPGVVALPEVMDTATIDKIVKFEIDQMVEFDADMPSCGGTGVEGFQQALCGMPGPRAMGVASPGRFGPPPGDGPLPSPPPDPRPSDSPRPDSSPRTWKSLDDCERGTERARGGKPVYDTPCRKMIWEKNVLPASEGRTELRLTFSNPFDSPARCSVAITAKGTESETSQRATLSLAASQTKVQSLFYLIEPGAAFNVKPDCTWEKATEIKN